MHNDHSSHPDVDRLFCRNGTKLFLDIDANFNIGGRRIAKGEELGRDCSGRTRAKETGLKPEPAIGLVEMLSGTGGGKWPKVSKEATWGVSGAFLDNWGRSPEVREAEKTRMADEKGLTTLWRHCHRDENKQTWRCRDLSDTEKAYEYWDNLMKRYEIPARARWLSENPGWQDEERRRLEVDASSQVAGEIADMGPEIKAVCEVN